MNTLSSYVIAIYLRLSSEDTDLKQTGKLESDSISNQRNLLHAFISRDTELAGATVVEFCDDGWSGKNFERPGVQEMIAQARQGKIQCIIVKDLSRFGRDHLIVGNYISRVFPFLGVRFIAINDGIDSIRPGDIDSLETSFKAILYDLYSRDLSRKVRSAKEFRARRGDFLSPFAPFGYIKDPDKKGHLLIDPPAAEIVRRIFQLTIEGKRRMEIARILNREAVLTPMLYKRASGCSRTIWPCIHEENFWTDLSVTKILRDERYIGSNVYGKRIRDQVGNTHTVKVRKSDWITVAESHDGIVTREEFDRAQAAMQDYEEHDASTYKKRPLRRKVICGICGHTMTCSREPYAYFSCHTSRVAFDYPCSEEPIPAAEIQEIILSGLRIRAEMAVEMEHLWAELHKCSASNPNNVRKKLSALKEIQAQQEQKAKELYETFALKEISKAEYLASKEAIVKSRSAVAMQIEELKSCLDNTGLNGQLQNRFVSCFQKYQDVDELTREIVDDVLERVIVYPGKRLEIVWNYREDFEKLLLDLNMGGCTNGKESGVAVLQSCVS